MVVKSIVIYVPMHCCALFKGSIQGNLLVHLLPSYYFCVDLFREIEKKFSDKHVVILGARRIVPRMLLELEDVFCPKLPLLSTMPCLMTLFFQAKLLESELVSMSIVLNCSRFTLTTRSRAQWNTNWKPFPLSTKSLLEETLPSCLLFSLNKLFIL